MALAALMYAIIGALCVSGAAVSWALAKLALAVIDLIRSESK